MVSTNTISKLTLTYCRSYATGLNSRAFIADTAGYPQNYGASGLFPSSGFLKSRKHDGRWKKSRTSAILSVIHHHQHLLDANCRLCKCMVHGREIFVCPKRRMVVCANCLVPVNLSWRLKYVNALGNRKVGDRCCR
jgi:hypothetical protein